jgi:hypothetical protein
VSRGVEVERLHARQMGEKSSLDRKKLKKLLTNSKEYVTINIEMRK